MTRSFKDQRGETLIGVLTALALAGIVLSAAVTNFSQSWKRSSDTRMMAQAETEVRTILDLISYDLRMLGSGMPLGQTGFAIDDATLGTASTPILVSSTASAIDFRLNQQGVSTILTSNYTPSSSSLILNVASTSGFAVGGLLYISNMSTLGTGGLQGTISAVSSSQLTISSSYVSTPSTTFNAGSIVEPVTTVNLTSGTGGITRNSGSGAVLLSPRSTLTLTYLDSAGTTLTLPLTVTSIKNSLSAIKIVVTVKSPRALSSGDIYTARAEQTVALRNLVLSR